MEFGIIIGCSAGDFHFAKGCLASVNYFMPGVPVCLLIDGEVDTVAAEKSYGCLVLRKKDIQNDFLKNNSFGWGITKMNSFWESPFERFLFLDADVCMWGNLVENVNWEDCDMLIDQPQYDFNTEAINTWFFDTQKLKGLDIDFNPALYENRYFCTGVFFAKKNIFPLEWYQELMEVSKGKDLFKFGEMGMLNYMIFKSVDKQKIKVKNHYIQHICPDFEKNETASLFKFNNNIPIVTKPMVIHYNGNRKPFMDNKVAYHEPMTFFRMQYLKSTQPDMSEKAIYKLLAAEDKKYKKKIPLKDQFKNVIRPFAKPIYTGFRKLVKR